MKIYKPHVVEVNVRSTETTTFADTRRLREITSINLRCHGELKDGTTVEFEIQTSQEEREVLISNLDDILVRFIKENPETDEKKPATLAGIKYEDG